MPTQFPTHRFTFRRIERLKSRKTIETLFTSGNSFSVFPLRFVWIQQPVPTDNNAATILTASPPIQFGVSVPKRWFKQANVRNRLKRRMREAYRLQKNALFNALSPEQYPISLMCIFVAKTELPYADIAAKMTIGLQKLKNEIVRE